MFCPRCGAEYQPGFTECFDCLVSLVDGPGGPDAPPPSLAPAPDAEALRCPLELVTVFTTGDAGTIALGKSLLQSTDIPFATRNEEI